MLCTDFNPHKIFCMAGYVRLEYRGKQKKVTDKSFLFILFCFVFFIYLFLNVTILCVIKCVSMCFHQSLVKCIWSSHTPPTPLPDSLLFTPCSCPRCCIAYAEGFRCVFDVCVRSMCSGLCVCVQEQVFL